MKRVLFRFMARAVLFWVALFPAAAFAFDTLTFDVSGDDQELQEALREASRVAALHDAGGDTDGGDVLGAALSDYRNLVGTLYANGYYSGVINIRIDGREAAEVALLSVPNTVRRVDISVDPGRAFKFGEVAITPQPPNSTVNVPQRSETAESTRVKDAVGDTIDAWREIGHAKARPVSQRAVADHDRRRLDVAIGINPGPRATFGELVLTAPSEVRAAAIRRIAGLPTGEVFAPGELDIVANRLRRTGAFTSVNLSEAETLGPNDTLDIELTVADQKPRRFGFGAEVSSFEGLELSTFWLHRNFRGGAERLRFDAKVSNIAADGDGVDYEIGLRYDIPAVFGPDTTLFYVARAEHLDEPDFTSDTARLGVGATRIYSDVFSGEASINLEYSRTTDDLGTREFTLLTFPATGTWDRRDDELNPSEGSYIGVTLMPFVGLNGSASGLRSELDARAYRSFGEEGGVVLAGRLQLGSVAGPALQDVRPDLLFASGGGGTVRGQPYLSLNVELDDGEDLGGRSFVGLSTEIRTAITDTIGIVGFFDAGYIGEESFYNGEGEWHSGAGLGLRYQTGIGPIRLDVAAPVSGDTGAGVQLYVGIGQAF